MNVCYDAAVVGAGPAGSTLSRLLARGGLRVILLDREIPGQRRVCGGFLGPEVSEIFKKIGLEQEFKNFPKNPINRVMISSMRTRPIESRFAGGAGWAVSRNQFDSWLSLQAVKSGARLVSETELTEARYGDGPSWRLRLRGKNDSREITSRHLIYATGRRPSPGRASKIFFACKTSHAGVQMPSDRVTLHFVEKGPVGLNPFAKNSAAMCLYVEGSFLKRFRGDLDKMMAYFTRMNPYLRQDLDGAERSGDWHVCSAEPDRRSVYFKDGAFFAGDAVTMLDPVIGGGIPIAMGSAVILSKLLTDAHRSGISDKKIALNYARIWKRQFRHQAALAAVLGRLERWPRMYSIFFKLMAMLPAAFPSLVSLSRPEAGEKSPDEALV